MYNYIIAGGGCAGLSLAYRLQRLSHPFRLLLIDQERKEKNDRTWCFWHTDQPPCEELISHRWSHAIVRSEATEIVRDISPYQYCMIRGADFYRHINAALDSDPRITRLYGLVDAIVDSDEHVAVTVDNQTYRGQLLFDSTFEPRKLAATIPPKELLLQHFFGQFIECDKPIFDPTTATLFDFRTTNTAEMQFIYLLPFSATRALIEHTVFSPRPYPEEYYRNELARYATKHLPRTAYRVIEEERGIIPMTAHHFPRRLGRRVVAIGTKGGRVKPSTGFAFLRIQRDAEQIARLLEQSDGALPRLPRDRLLYRLMDAMMIEVMRRHPDRAQTLFVRLFARNPIQRVFALLDEELSLGGTLRLMATMPWGLFCAALLRWEWRQLSFRLRRRGGRGAVQAQSQAQAPTE